MADNLVDTTQVLIAGYAKAGIELPSRFPENAYELATALKSFLWAISPRNDIPYADIEPFATSEALPSGGNHNLDGGCETAGRGYPAAVHAWPCAGRDGK